MEIILAIGEIFDMVKIIIVNEKDEIIDHKERGTLNKNDIYRVSALWIMNSKGEVLLAQRSFNKKNNPGKWGPAVAGTNDIGETYLSNIIKEAEEEIGINIPNPKKLQKNRINGKNNYFVQWYYLELDKEIIEFALQEDEVEKIKWFSKEEFLEGIENLNSDFLDTMREYTHLIDLVKNFK